MSEFITEFTRLRNCYTCRRDHPERSLSGYCSKCTPQKVVSEFKKFIRSIYSQIINPARAEMVSSGQTDTTIKLIINVKASKHDVNRWINQKNYISNQQKKGINKNEY